ncbi:MAG: phosphoribosylformylglycinamidine cyclo-ligase [Actinobacteria bacterium]|nr:phosphoribosylformylglycinamidine cyclo-ligase [Actinomycetota bacterium]
MAKTLTYKDSGVNIDAGDAVAGAIGRMARSTFGPRVVKNDMGFAGLFRLDYNEKLFKRNYRDPILLACTDGVGTKLKLAIELQKFDTVGIDLVAMSVNDLIVQGAEPMFFLDYLAVNKVDDNIILALMEGICEACRQADAALLGGETAEMPDFYAPGDFDMAGFAVGVVERKKVITGRYVEPGDYIIGLASSGLHSNGYSLVRKIIAAGKRDLNSHIPALARTLGQELLEPTKVYVRAVRSVLGHYRVKHVVRAMAHITGGGLPGNLSRVLPDECQAVIKKDSWPKPPVFDLLAKWGPVDEEEMYRVFNMGIGYVLVVRPTFADSILAQLKRTKQPAYLIGRIRRGPKRVILE